MWEQRRLNGSYSQQVCDAAGMLLVCSRHCIHPSFETAQLKGSDIIRGQRTKTVQCVHVIIKHNTQASIIYATFMQQMSNDRKLMTGIVSRDTLVHDAQSLLDTYRQDECSVRFPPRFYRLRLERSRTSLPRKKLNCRGFSVHRTSFRWQHMSGIRINCAGEGSTGHYIVS